MPCQLFDQRPLADDDPGLRTTEQLVPREGYQRRAGLDGFLHRRLVAESEGLCVEQRARAEVVDHRHASSTPQFD